ncbi:calphotin-like isoform X1 [Daphnia pulex]|uniref:calphotin-like isoform X1 n=1 Tax=Daphnia pulex TaxID=6669 RepID=UPI001EDE9C23|nr:calphotin-like isoform X1 [Daphnia pulex]XP_046438020.1 calphotin-like isoform X1 [Daphnia pulex]XP_046438021.1 calphotin-like isoform X1 [Daphnia pulex]
MLAPQSCLTVMAVLMGAVPLHLAFPSGQTWFIHHSGQVARPVMINSSPVSDEFPIPRFALPEQTASRRQDGPFQASGSNNLQNEPPVHVKPGDKVSLIVRNQNPLEAQKFVDVGALLMDLQRMPPASDGSYHVFLAPPNYPQPTGGQKFDVTYVGAPQREQQTVSDPRNPHPPLFVAPLDYSVPQGYGRVQIPIQNVKFALNSPFQQVQQQPAQFQQPQQQFRQPQPQFQPTQQQPIQPVQFQQPQPVQFQQPQVVQFQPPQLQPVQFQTPQPPQFQTPQPVQFQPQFQPSQPQFQPSQPQFQPPQPQFQPIPAQQPQFQPQFQKQTVVSEFQRPQFQQPPPPSSFEQSLSDIRLQTGFVPFQTLEETSTSPPVTQPAPPPPPPTQPAPPPAPKEPLVLAAESPEFLELIKPRPAPIVVEVVENAPVSEIPQPATQSPVVVPPEEKVAPVIELKPVSSPAIIPASFESAPEVPANTVTLIPPPQEDAPLPAPTPAFEQTIPAATPIPAPEISGVTETTQTRPLKKRPINRIPLEGGVPQWPDFQAVRQRQQLQRQQNRKKITPSSGNNFEPILSQTQPDAPVDPTSFGQKIRNKVKTNSLVSPPLPVPVEPQVVVQQPKAQSFIVEPAAVEQTQHDSFDLDPPVVERDESFQTLESQNAASGNQRGRIRFNRPNSLNVIPAEASTAPPVRHTVSTLVGGRGRIRINSNSFTTPTPTTAGPTVAATEASTAAPTTVQTAAPTVAATTTPTVAATTASTTPESTTVAATVPTVAPTASRLVDPVVTEGPALEEEIIRGDSPIVLVEETVPVAEEEEDVPLEEEEEEEQAVLEDEKSVEPAEKPWSPYEAIQRQRETTVEPEAASQVVSSNDQPLRIRGKTTFSSSRIPLPPVRPEVGNRPVVLRPAASIRRPLPPTIRITKPVFDIQGQENIRSQEDFIAPQSLEFGIRDGVESKPILINNSPAQFLLPVGRRVPETRPGIQNIRIGRPTTQAPTTTTTTTTTEAPVEEEPVDAFQQEADELVTDEPLANDQLLPEEGEEEGEGELVEEEVEEEILTDEIEGEENEEFVETVDETEPVVSSTAAPTVTTAEAFSEFVDEQEEVEVDPVVVEDTNKSAEPITTTTEAPVVIEESIVPAEEEVEEEGAIELAADNHVDDQSNPSESSDDERQVLGVSTATEVSLMYELCYRGRCVRVHE